MTSYEIDPGGHPGPRRRLNPAHLPLLDKIKREYQKSGEIDWPSLQSITQNGTSQGEASRITGINQSWISRKLRWMKGSSWDEMDAARLNRTTREGEASD